MSEENASDQDPERTLSLNDVTEASPEQRVGSAVGPGDAGRLPKFIGDYRILGLLGAGGMGIVYEAEQRSPSRRVALKVMRQRHFVGESEMRHFRREVETLGRLKHPNIATIFESGQTDDGMAFYAMELVQGVTLDAWLASRPAPMTPKEQKLRLRMFRTICEAVHYAHLRGVIHRDLKPANIMVLAEQPSPAGASDAVDPLIKILDFGLARLVDPEAQAASVRTELGVILGTLQYMSPEQARGETQAIDLRTDVYALGVILFEMMAGRRPYDLTRAALGEAVRVICEEPPSKLTRSGSGSRAADADLATIVGKSLEKEPDRRYPSAGALSEDVERFLSSQPIQVRPSSRIYRTRMFVRRHRLGVGASAAILAILATFAVAMVIQSRRIAREAEVSRRVAAFMTQMFKLSNPNEAEGNSITAREILDRASKEITTGLNQDPEIQARLMRWMGTSYTSLGLYSKAEDLLESSTRQLRSLLGADNIKTAESVADLATVYALEGRFKEAEQLYLEAIPVIRRVEGVDDQATLQVTRNLAETYVSQGRYPDAGKLALEVIASTRRVLGPEHDDTVDAMSLLADVYRYQGRYEEAWKIFEDCYRIQSRVHGPDHPATMHAMHNLAMIVMFLKRYPEAEKLDKEVVEIERRLLGPEHPQTLEAMNNLGLVYALEGRDPDSETLNLEILRIERKVLGPKHPNVGNTLYTLACLKARAGKKDEAIGLLQEAVQATLLTEGAWGMATDSDLEPLHGDPRFEALVAEVARIYGKPARP